MHHVRLPDIFRRTIHNSSTSLDRSYIRTDLRAVMTADLVKPVPTSADAYFKSLDEERHDLMMRVRNKILDIWPEAEEGLTAGIPTYRLDGHPFLSLASRKNYIALYIVPHDLLNVFKTELRQYDHGRSCIRFKRIDRGLMGLLEQIIRYTGDQLTTSRYFKGSKAEEALEVLDPEFGTRRSM